MSFEETTELNITPEIPINDQDRTLDGSIEVDATAGADPHRESEISTKKQNKEGKIILTQTLVEKIKQGEAIDEDLKSVTEETLQKALALGLKEAIKYGRSIDRHLNLATKETLQKALKQGLRERIISGESINRYLLLATEETIEKIKRDQKLIGIGLVESIKNGRSIDEYLTLATEEMLQESLRQGLAERIGRGQDIGMYSTLATEETLLSASAQELRREIINGFDVDEYFKLATEEAKEYLLGDTEKLKECVRESVASFFREDFRLTIEKHLQEVIGSLSREQIWNALFDHTTLPIGIKFHVPNNTPLSQMLHGTGGFVAHGEEQCFVANPLHNQTLVTIAFDAMENYLRENRSGLEDINYIQTCCLGRLPNKESGIATIAFLMTKDRKEQIDSKTLVHGQKVFGVTIPDGGRVKGDYIIPNEEMGFSRPIIKERTDMLFCRDKNEVFLANDLLTLLNHASLETDKPLLFKKLGEQFIKEVVFLLKQHGLAEDLRKTTFINARNEDIPKLLELIEKTKESRLMSEELLKKIKKANNFVLHSDNDEEIEQVRASYENLVKEYQNTLPYKLAILVEKYRNSMRPEGLTRQVIEDRWMESES